MQTGPFFARVRPFAILSKLMATFPVHNVFTNDGRQLKHRWLSITLIYDLVVYAVVISFFIYNALKLIEAVRGHDDKFYLIIWLWFTFIAAGLRNFVQFTLCHVSARHYPHLFEAIEVYYSGIGAEVIERRRDVLRMQAIPIARVVMFLVILTFSSYSFFIQFNSEFTWSASMSYVLVNLWKELPMSMFICLCAHLRQRFTRLIEALAACRNCGGDDAPAVKRLENVRLQYAALTNILGRIEKCFGTQIAANTLFLVLDCIIQLFIFFVYTSADNVFLLTLAIYFFIAACGFVFQVDRLQRKAEGLLDELNAFELEGKSINLKYQVKLFTAQISARPIKVSASGFCIVNNTLVAGLFGAIATYLIVMLNSSQYILAWANDTISTRRAQFNARYVHLT
ncbi:uncharacterized protein LOC135941159 [Cloeon dipterum]|uniref:uncharacterized protein LOC135941159 n=1 Tax=Cloeon dipterum TaxID=197152 RepID=UPI00321FC00D